MDANTVSKTWERACLEVLDRKLIDPSEAEAFLPRIHPQVMSKGFTALYADNEFIAQWFRLNYADVFASVLGGMLGTPFRVEIKGPDFLSISPGTPERTPAIYTRNQYLVVNSGNEESSSLASVLNDKAASQLASFYECKPRYAVSVETIILVIEQYYQLSPGSLLGKSRERNVSNARHLAAYLCRAMLGYPYQQIGNFFERDHSTIINSTKRIEDALKHDMALSVDLNAIVSTLLSSSTLDAVEEGPLPSDVDSEEAFLG